MRRESRRRPRMCAAAALLAAVFAGLWSPDVVAQPVMKIGFGTINDVQHEYVKQLAAEMEKRAPGSLKIEIYPADQLGAAPRLIEGLGLGTVEGFVAPPEFFVGVDPRFQIMGAPGLVKDIEHGQRLLEDASFRKALLSYGDTKGIKSFGAFVYGPNLYATRTPVRSISDFKGLKLRVFGSPMHTLAMERLGASGVPMPPADALVAIGSGAIDGNRTGMSVLISFKYNDIVKSATIVEGDAMVFSLFAIGKAWFEKLSKGTQDALVASAKAAEQNVASVSITNHKRGEELWKERGGELIRFSGTDQAEFVKRMLTVGPEVVSKNPRIKDDYALMLNRAEATR
ncbi:MAG: hypothetical protein QOF09_1183 [Alphaproteobacteria bacterium]|nr:hypothetical protein [Alphaproteobacteria bacterium]